ncbi:MAG: tetraacyldisaccharide 4'-kinase [Candidatus Omnitrophota bacterium]
MVRFILLLLSFIYGFIIRVFSGLASQNKQSFSCKVISVGNITWGGTGKTVAVEYITRFLRSKGRRIAVISRGYKRRTKDEGRRTIEELGDEPQMLKDKLPDVTVLSGPDRQVLIKSAISGSRADTAILDDGFQQWRINRDLDIVTIDANNPFGCRHMIPRGILREPLRALKRADIFLLSKTDTAPDVSGLRDYLKKINPQALIVLSCHKEGGFVELFGKGLFIASEELKNKNVILASGIADPGSFEKMAGRYFKQVFEHIRFDDHHNYSVDDAQKIMSLAAAKGAEAVVITEKDAVKLKNLFLLQPEIIPVYVLKIELEITQYEEEFHRRLLRACGC